MFASGGVIAILLGPSGANWTLVFILIALAGSLLVDSSWC
jgi:hypothetical protein